ncbi:MAG: helix-turn-helix domain-containing protein [Kineosporiaceae bacterium]
MAINDVTGTTSTDDGPAVDALTIGKRVRHLRRAKGWTLAQLGEATSMSPGQLSLIENGRREPKLSQLQRLATALGATATALLAPEPPTRRAALEIAWERAQRSDLYAGLGLPELRIGPRTSTEVVEALVGLYDEVVRRATIAAATPEEARRANRELRLAMRRRNNYYPEIEAAAAGLLRAVGHQGGPMTQRMLGRLAEHLGFEVHRVPELPHSTRSLTDLRHRRLYIELGGSGGHDERTIVLQTLGHFVLGHTDPHGYADFLRQRVEANYFAAAILVPEAAAVPLLMGAKQRREIDIEDLRDVFAVSQETAAHRFTNLATRHLGLPVHFMRVDRSGVVYKAYENDGVRFPTDATGAIEGQYVCRHWTARVVFSATNGSAPYHQYTDTPTGTFWCTAHLDTDRGHAGGRQISIAVGVPHAHVKWFRGRDTTERSVSRCPDESCCRRPPADLSARWHGYAWPSARAQSHVLAAMPPGTFPGVDDTEVYEFLDAHGD